MDIRCPWHVRWPYDMALLAGDERAFARGLSRLAFANPFLPERIEWERETLGSEFVAAGTLWDSAGELDPPNVRKLRERAEVVARAGIERLARGVRPTAEELGPWEDLALYLLFARYEGNFFDLIG